MITHMESNTKLNPTVMELFLKKTELDISLVFISQSYFKVSKTVRLNTTHYFYIKTPSITQLQQISFNNSSGIDFKDFVKLYKDYTKKRYSILVNDTALSSDNPLRFKKNLL